VPVSAAKTSAMTHPSSLWGNYNLQMPQALPIDMRCQSDASSLQSQIVTSETYACPCS
jgi:hypothetical protein